MREKSRERGRGRGGDGDKGEQRKRRVGLHSLLRPCVLRAEGGDCWWFGHTVNSVQFSCDIFPSVSSVPI